MPETVTAGETALIYESINGVFKRVEERILA